jgi:hypothetical protein
MFAHLLAAAVFAISTGEKPPPALDDEARIEELFNLETGRREAAVREAEDRQAAEAEAVAVQFPPPSGGAVEFDDLGKLVGYGVRVHVGAHVHVGRIQKVLKDAVTLKSAMGGGFAEFTLNKRQISSIEMQ